MNSSWYLTNNGSFITQGNVSSGSGEARSQFLWLEYVGYVAIFLVSLFGNSVIIHIIRTDNSMKTTTNYLIINQACADLLISFTEVVNVIHYSSIGGLWLGGILGQITCKLFIAIVFSPTHFSVWILATIAVDRFYAVVRPLRLSPISQHLKKIIFLLWAWSFAFASNYYATETLKTVKRSHLCDLTSIIDEWSAFNTITFTLNVFLPLFIITILYTIVCRKLWSREVPGEGANQNEQQAEAVKTARKVTRMMVVVVVLYVLCWFPLYIMVLSHFIGHMQPRRSLLLFVNFLTLSYSGLNPYVYLILSQNFRNGFKKLFRKCLGKFRVLNVVPLRSQSVELEQI
ncbi:hypothetical protein ACROYT_G003766 [Oculina patagonica]